MSGIRAQIAKSNKSYYTPVTMEILEGIVQDLITKPVEPERHFVLRTGEWGMISFDFALMGLKYNFKLSSAKPIKNGKYKYQINLFEKHGIYKLYVTTWNNRNVFVLKKGTIELGKSNNQQYLISKLKTLKLI
jgi:hypothetical protein